MEEHLAEAEHGGGSQLHVVLFRLSHLVQLEEHQTSIDTLGFKKDFNKVTLAWRAGPEPDVIKG